MTLRQKYCQVISAFPYKPGRYGMDEEDYFSTLVLLCLEADRGRPSLRGFRARADRLIRAELETRRQETQTLYNPFKNLYLDQCYGDGKTPLGTWMDLSRETRQ